MDSSLMHPVPGFLLCFSLNCSLESLISLTLSQKFNVSILLFHKTFIYLSVIFSFQASETKFEILLASDIWTIL